MGILDEKTANSLFLEHVQARDLVTVANCLKYKKKKYGCAQNDEGQTALMLAVLNSDVKMVKLLIREGHVDPSIKNKAGNTALELAVSQGDGEISSLLADLTRLC